MTSKQFVGVPRIVASFAFSFILVDQLRRPMLAPSENRGFGWISFLAWAVYFLAGCNEKGAVKTWLGYAVGVIMTMLIFELAGFLGQFGFYAVPVAAFTIVTAVIFTEQVPPFDLIPAIFIGAGAMVCFLSYMDNVKYAKASLVILLYSAIGLLYGHIAVLLGSIREKGARLNWTDDIGAYTC